MFGGKNLCYSYQKCKHVCKYKCHFYISTSQNLHFRTITYVREFSTFSRLFLHRYLNFYLGTEGEYFHPLCFLPSILPPPPQYQAGYPRTFKNLVAQAQSLSGALTLAIVCGDAPLSKSKSATFWLS